MKNSAGRHTGYLEPWPRPAGAGGCLPRTKKTNTPSPYAPCQPQKMSPDGLAHQSSGTSKTAPSWDPVASRRKGGGEMGGGWLPSGQGLPARSQPAQPPGHRLRPRGRRALRTHKQERKCARGNCCWENSSGAQRAARGASKASPPAAPVPGPPPGPQQPGRAGCHGDEVIPPSGFSGPRRSRPRATLS